MSNICSNLIDFFCINEYNMSMIKIWGKVVKNEIIKKHMAIEIDETATTFFDMLRTISEKLNLPTPVLLDKHVYDFNVFHICIFNPDDYVEVVNFDKFILELVST